jgi:Spx/MgsR family transcriptional regulator
VAYLEGKGVELVKHDFAKDPPSRELLEKLIDESHLHDFLNTRSPAYKERKLGSRKLTRKQAIDLMLEDPNLIRRPIVLRDPRHAIFGFDAEEYDHLT